MAEILHVQQRQECGKAQNRRLRRNGRLPAVLYGHGEQAVSLSLSVDEMEATLRHGAQVVDLEGVVSGQALLQDIQWDVFMQHVLHVDLLRIQAGDRVTVTVPVELRGEAPGTHDGGIVELLIHEVELEVAPADVPEKLYVNINHLELNQTLTAAQFENLPPGAKLAVSDEMPVAQCTEPVAQPEELEEEAATQEPEIIGQKAEEAEEGNASG